MTRKGDFMQTLPPAAVPSIVRKFGVVFQFPFGEEVEPGWVLGFGTSVDLFGMAEIPDLGIAVFAQATMEDMSDDISLSISVDFITLHLDRSPVATKDSRFQHSGATIEPATLQATAAQDGLSAASHDVFAQVGNSGAQTARIEQIVIVIDALSIAQLDVIAPV